ncbi:MAG TPA: sensor histidine kinase [Methylophilaceae bacterium]|jgi:two-component system sensor histidine kinase TctE
MNKQISLRHQLLFWLIISLTLILSIGAVASYYRASYFASLAYDRSLFRAALALADQVEVIKGRVYVDLPQEALDLLEYDKDDWIYYQVTGPNGELVAGDKGIPLPTNLPLAGKHIYYDTVFDDKPVRVTAFSLPLTGTSADGDVLVQVAETLSKRETMVREIMEATIMPQLLITLLATLLMLYGVKRGLLPLDRLRLALSQRSHRDLSPVPEAGAPLEVQPLLIAMNDLMQRVHEAIGLQQRFIADASHQLRTPLAGLQTQAEMALREQDPQAVRNALEHIRASTVRLSHLIHQLLSLARVEPGSGRDMGLATLDLAVLAREVTSEWVTPALAKQIDLGFEAASNPVMISGDAILLREMLSNLVDNAIQYTPAGGEVTVSVLLENDHATLVVEDNGIGIPQTEREQVFERFHRVSDSNGIGCGLGLAIVREIVQAHNAAITLNSGSDGQGTRVEVILPLGTVT